MKDFAQAKHYLHGNKPVVIELCHSILAYLSSLGELALLHLILRHDLSAVPDADDNTQALS